MRDLTNDNFGLLIAYLLPGFVVLWGASYHADAVRSWMASTPSDAPTVGGFLFATLASTAAGLIASAVRWATIDRILRRFGLRQPAWNFELFADRLAAYEVLVAQHYRYYQFYANTLVALAWTYGCRFAALGPGGPQEFLVAAGFLLIEAVLFAGSWDTLQKYYDRTGALLRAGADATPVAVADSDGRPRRSGTTPVGPAASGPDQAGPRGRHRRGRARAAGRGCNHTARADRRGNRAQR